MKGSIRSRIKRTRSVLADIGERYGDWLGVVVRANLLYPDAEAEPPGYAEVLARHWGVSTAEAARRVQLHIEFLAAHHPAVWHRLHSLDPEPGLVRQLAEDGHPLFPGFPPFPVITEQELSC